MKKLQVTLEDSPTDIELAQYKRMFEAACSALGEVSHALGCDPEEGGAEPLLAAIAKLKNSKQEQGEPVALDIEDLSHSAYEEAMSFGLSRDVFLRYFKGIVKHYITPQQRKPLTDEQIKNAILDDTIGGSALMSMMRDEVMVADVRNAINRIARAIEAAHGITK